MEAVDQFLTSVDCCYKFSSFPQTYQEAMESSESSSWKVAMKDEGKHSVGGYWVYTVKDDSTGGKTFKAR